MDPRLAASKPPRPVAADTLSRHLDELCRPGALDRRRDGERQLLDYVDAEARDLSADAFGRFMNDIYARIASLINKRYLFVSLVPLNIISDQIFLEPPQQ